MHPQRAARQRDQIRLARDSRWEDLHRRTVFWEFPAESRLGYQLAFLIPFTVPRMATVLMRGTVAHDANRRAYHTALIIHEILARGLDSPEAHRLIRHINRAHQAPGITQPDMTYVLDALLVMPLRWITLAGWRPPLSVEQDAAVWWCRRLGALMGVQGLPHDLRDSERRFDRYSAQHIGASPDTEALGRAVMHVIQGRFPRPLRPLAPRAFASVIGAAPAAALGLPAPLPGTGPTVAATRAVRGAYIRRTRPPQRPYFSPGQPAGTIYPSGYTLDDIAPQ